MSTDLTAIQVQPAPSPASSPTSSATPPITGEELFEMGGVGRVELIEGRIMRMSPTGYAHGEYELSFGAILRAFVRQHDLGKVMVGEVGLYTQRDPDTVRGADALFISHARFAQRQSDSYLDVAPELIVEIMSPNDKWTDITQKLREYFEIGVQLVWIADPTAKIVYAYRSMTDVREFTAGDTLPGDDVLPDFAVQVGQLFET